MFGGVVRLFWWPIGRMTYVAFNSAAKASPALTETSPMMTLALHDGIEQRVVNTSRSDRNTISIQDRSSLPLADKTRSEILSEA